MLETREFIYRIKKMGEILEKLSSYNIFTNLLPGIVFCFIADSYLGYPLIQGDVLIGVFLYYFIGLVISRIGSLIVEPFLKFIGILKYSDHKNYVIASEKDQKIESLLETNNVYRSTTSLFLCILILVIFDAVKAKWPVVGKLGVHFTLIVLLVIFLFSYVKQTNYIRKRVDIACSNNSEDEKGAKE